MRQENITLKNVEISELFDRIKEHFQEIELDIIQEEKQKDYALNILSILHKMIKKFPR